MRKSLRIILEIDLSFVDLQFLWCYLCCVLVLGSINKGLFFVILGSRRRSIRLYEQFCWPGS